MREPVDENRELVATPKQWRMFIEVFERPAGIKPELARLFSGRQKLDFTTENAEGVE